MIETAVALTGVFVGLFTGFVPGIHPNTVVFLSLPMYYASEIDLTIYMIFIASLSVSHTLHSFLPAIFLEAPEPSTALGTLPGPEMASEGRGIEAFQCTAFGGFIGGLTVLLIAPLLLMFLRPVYSLFTEIILFVLIFFLFFAVLKSNDVVGSAVLVVMSGLLGLYSFNMPVNQNYVLMPVFSGLFAVPAVIDSLLSEEEWPEQQKNISTSPNLRPAVTGTLSGLLAGTVPGIGPAISTSSLTPLMDKSRTAFLTALGAVNTVDIMASVLVLYTIERARSGASVAIQQLTVFTEAQLATTLGASIFALGLSFLISLRVSSAFPLIIQRFDFSRILKTVIMVLAVSTYIFTGLLGLLVLATASCIGLNARAKGERAVLMSVLILPSILYFSGIGVFM